MTLGKPEGSSYKRIMHVETVHDATFGITDQIFSAGVN